MSIGRTHYCGELRKAHIGQDVELKGWVSKRRDLGGVIFIDLRDRSGVVQIVFNPEQPEAHALADKMRNEYVVAARGKVVERDPETVNPKLETGDIEVHIEELELINQAKNPPFMIQDEIDVDESIRLEISLSRFKKTRNAENV